MEKEMEKIAPEVLIYIQNLRNYLETNENVKSYFIYKENEDEFYSEVLKISQSNYTKTGQPMLSIEQLENVRKNTFTNVINEEIKNIPEKYLDFKEYGKFYLN